MSKLFILLFLASCATHSPTPVSNERVPASVFSDTYNVPGGKAKLKKEIDAYHRMIDARIQNSTQKDQDAWTRACNNGAATISMEIVMSCFDREASKFFPDVSWETIVPKLEKSDLNTLKNNWLWYQVFIMKHYKKISETLPD